MKWTSKGYEYNEIANRIISNNYSVVIWGAGTFGTTFYNEFSDKIKIECFVDSDIEKQGKEICGIKVFHPIILKERKDSRIVLVSTGRTREVYQKLEENGYIKHKDFYHIDEFASIFFWYRDKILYANFLSLPITDYCSLKCEKCSAFNPYIHNKKHYSIIEISERLELYFRWVDRLDVLAISGGDSFLNPNMFFIIDELGKQYHGKRINNIEIYSNAVIIPDDSMIELMKKYNIIYRFTDYGEATKGKQKINDVIKILDNNGIKYDKATFASWCDCGYPQESNGIVSDEDLIHFYDECDRRSCMTIYKNRLYYCGMAVAADMANYCKCSENDGFDLTNNNINKTELMEFILGFNERGYLEYCKKCNGGPNINNHYVVPGLQIGRR